MFYSVLLLRRFVVIASRCLLLGRFLATPPRKLVATLHCCVLTPTVVTPWLRVMGMKNVLIMSIVVAGAGRGQELVPSASDAEPAVGHSIYPACAKHHVSNRSTTQRLEIFSRRRSAYCTLHHRAALCVVIAAGHHKCTRAVQQTCSTAAVRELCASTIRYSRT